MWLAVVLPSRSDSDPSGRDIIAETGDKNIGNRDQGLGIRDQGIIEACPSASQLIMDLNVCLLRDFKHLVGWDLLYPRHLLTQGP